MKTKDTLEEIPQIHGRRLPKKVLDWHKKEVEKVLDRVEYLLKDHYWDTFSDEKTILFKHFEFILSKLRKEYEKKS